MCVYACVSDLCFGSNVSLPGGNGKQELDLWQVFMFQTFLCVPSSAASALLRVLLSLLRHSDDTANERAVSLYIPSLLFFKNMFQY